MADVVARDMSLHECLISDCTAGTVTLPGLRTTGTRMIGSSATAFEIGGCSIFSGRFEGVRIGVVRADGSDISVFRIESSRIDVLSIRDSRIRRVDIVDTQIGLLDSAYLWLMALLVLLAAIGGKGIACWLAARATGISNREALGIGTLMNARGLMELIIINIGLQRGIISPALFATLVIMAVVTTLMASPIFELLVARFRPEPEPEPLNTPAPNPPLA